MPLLLGMQPKTKEEFSMQVLTRKTGGVLQIKLVGEMDEYSAPSARAECDRFILSNTAAKKVVIDLSEVAFMDSTGIGFLIGRYKKATANGMSISVARPNFTADKVLSVAGIYSLIPKE